MAGSRGSKEQDVCGYDQRYRNENRGTVARVELSAIFTALADGYTSQMSTDAKHDPSLGVLNSCIVRLGVSKRLNIDLPRLFDFVFGVVTDERGLSAPLDNDIHIPAFRNRGDSDCGLGEGKDVC